MPLLCLRLLLFSFLRSLGLTDNCTLHCVCAQEGDEAVADWWKRHPEQWQAGELLLACGATAVADLRAAVAAELDYSCSAGIAHNKASYQIASCIHASIAESRCNHLPPLL